MKKNGYRIYIETFGCQMNVSDSERMIKKLVEAGHRIISDEENAEVVLLNTCSVREKAEQKLYTRVGQFRKKDKKPLIGVAGCVAQLEGEDIFRKAEGVDFIVGTQAVGRIDGLIHEAFKGKMPVDLAEREVDYDWSIGSKESYSKFVAFLPIIEGCNKFCTYCIVPFSRGREKSLSPRLIIEQVQKLKAEGFRELHLIGQNVNSYRPQDVGILSKFNGATPFAKLLRAVAATGFERIKFTTSFPRDFHADIIEAINENENLCNWVHLPVQSGSNRILRLMRRGHTIEDYKKRVDIIRGSNRRISLTTDIIIGYPNETEEDFEATYKLFEYANFDSAYIFKYSPRHGTPAALQSDTVSPEVKSARFLRLEKLQRDTMSLSHKSCVGREMEVLVERKSTRSEFDLAGHTTCHRVVNFSGAEAVNIGSIVKVKITENKVSSLYGEFIGNG